jgi:hypothetical protein
VGATFIALALVGCAALMPSEMRYAYFVVS